MRTADIDCWITVKKRWTRKFSRKQFETPGEYGRPTRSTCKRSFKGNQHKPAQTTADKGREIEPEPEVVQQQQTLEPEEEQHTEPDPVHEVEEVNASSASGS